MGLRAAAVPTRRGRPPGPEARLPWPTPGRHGYPLRRAARTWWPRPQPPAPRSGCPRCAWPVLRERPPPRAGTWGRPTRRGRQPVVQLACQLHTGGQPSTGTRRGGGRGTRGRTGRGPCPVPVAQAPASAPRAGCSYWLGWHTSPPVQQPGYRRAADPRGRYTGGRHLPPPGREVGQPTGVATWSGPGATAVAWLPRAGGPGRPRPRAWPAHPGPEARVCLAARLPRPLWHTGRPQPCACGTAAGPAARAQALVPQPRLRPDPVTRPTVVLAPGGRPGRPARERGTTVVWAPGTGRAGLRARLAVATATPPHGHAHGEAVACGSATGLSAVARRPVPGLRP